MRAVLFILKLGLKILAVPVVLALTLFTLSLIHIWVSQVVRKSKNLSRVQIFTDRSIWTVQTHWNE